MKSSKVFVWKVSCSTVSGRVLASGVEFSAEKAQKVATENRNWFLNKYAADVRPTMENLYVVDVQVVTATHRTFPAGFEMWGEQSRKRWYDAFCSTWMEQNAA